eukprot:TRINITY_DN54433_c0_g1_i2.p1 TRINITY_DN54433_c0_g1~~TRINITY_DN54433_c0_g1_i2.p1  ORF type:complete len:175 (+),score=19.97 TRINITY_DN54433_c0_g1_i2:147-671(+)
MCIRDRRRVHGVVVILDEKGQLLLRFIDGPKIDQKFSFSPEKGPVRIGRMSDCEIRFDDPSVSRYQSNFKYKEGAWFIEDGWANSQSTNGTWLYIADNFVLNEGMIFKAGQTLFSVSLIPPTSQNHKLVTVSYTHLTLPTILLVQISVVAVSLKKKNQEETRTMIQPYSHNTTH